MIASTATLATKRVREEVRAGGRVSISECVPRSQIEPRASDGWARCSSAFFSASLIRLMWQKDKRRTNVENQPQTTGRQKNQCVAAERNPDDSTADLRPSSGFLVRNPGRYLVAAGVPALLDRKRQTG